MLLSPDVHHTATRIDVPSRLSTAVHITRDRNTPPCRTTTTLSRKPQYKRRRRGGQSVRSVQGVNQRAFRISGRGSHKRIAFTIRDGSVLELGLFVRITDSPTGMTCDVVTVAISRHVCLFFGNSIFLLVGLPNTNVTVKTVWRYHQRETVSAPNAGTSAVLQGGHSENFVNMLVYTGASGKFIEDAASPGCGTDWNINEVLDA